MDSSNLDRLSALPDSLILEILSLLPMNDVVGTMLLSKRWLHLWTAVPCLDFKYKSNYEAFVIGALAHWKGSKIRKFSLTFNDFLRVDMVDSWLLFAMEKQVEELMFYNYSHGEYCPPQGLYSCSSIIKMLLYDCYVRIDEAVQWNRLKSLEIRGVDSLSEDAMNRILAGAPLLEELILEELDCEGNLNIRSTSLNIRSTSLKILDLSVSVYRKVVRIWAPNLLDLEISWTFWGTFLLDAPSLTNAVICFHDSPPCYGWRLPPDAMFHQVFQSIRHVEKLTLSKIKYIKPLLSVKPSFEFPNAKSLSIDVGRAGEMLDVIDMFPNLTTLRVQHDLSSFAISEDLEKADHVIRSHLSKAALPTPFLPFLNRVEISWYMRTSDVSIIRALEILLENAKLLDKMVFRANWRRWDGDDNDKPELLLSKSASSPSAEVSIIHLDEFM